VKSTRAYAYIFPAERRVKSGDIYRVGNSWRTCTHDLHLPHLSTASLITWALGRGSFRRGICEGMEQRGERRRLGLVSNRTHRN